MGLEVIEQYVRVKNESYTREYYPRNITYSMIEETKKIIPPFSRILTGYETALMLTSYQPVMTFVGEVKYGPWNYKEETVAELLTGKLSRQEAQLLLKKYKIQYILDDPEHMEIRGWERLSLPYLHSIWKNVGYELFTM
jgi:hypothetical protein